MYWSCSLELNCVCVFSGKRVNGQHQPHHALQPGACLQQVLWEEGEGEAQQLPARVTRSVVFNNGYCTHLIRNILM